jgi:hypothetical protein
MYLGKLFYIQIKFKGTEREKFLLKEYRKIPGYRNRLYIQIKFKGTEREKFLLKEFRKIPGYRNRLIHDF